MYKLALYIKHRLPWIWTTIDRLNGFFFQLFFSDRLRNEAINQMNKHRDSVKYRLINQSDLSSLQQLLENQKPAQVKYFNPHSFEPEALKKMYQNPSFIMMGAFRNEIMVGYFFLRCFFNHKCFIGRLVDENFQRQGIARTMSDIMYHTAWNCGFRCMTTISTKNQAIYQLHEREGNTRVIKNLPDNYLLVEILAP